MATPQRLQEPFPAGRRGTPDLAGGAVVRILEWDPELAARVPPQHLTQARATLVARVRPLDRGIWKAPREFDPRHLGFLMLDGLLARDVILAGTTCTELFGPGDVVQPAGVGREESLVRYHVLWHSLEPVRLAELDQHFSRSLAAWPQVMRVLLERALKCSLRTSLHAALLQLSPVETRLLVLFWFLAERWGRVTSDGVVLRLRLSHRMLGQLVGVQRASVTTALHHIEESGAIARRRDRTWLLRGSPPDELAHMNWQSRHGALAASGA